MSTYIVESSSFFLPFFLSSSCVACSYPLHEKRRFSHQSGHFFLPTTCSLSGTHLLCADNEMTISHAENKTLTRMFQILLFFLSPEISDRLAYEIRHVDPNFTSSKIPVPNSNLFSSITQVCSSVLEPNFASPAWRGYRGTCASIP